MKLLREEENGSNEQVKNAATKTNSYSLRSSHAFSPACFARGGKQFQVGILHRHDPVYELGNRLKVIAQFVATFIF